MSASSARIVPLTWLSEADRTRAGAKAARLGDAARLGLRVPNGFCITAEALDDVVATLDAGDPRQLVRAIHEAPLRPSLAVEIVEAWEALGPGPVAVRSSAVDEDGLEQSFAGLHATTLNVTGAEDLVAAVRRCWASYWSEAALAYRAASGRPSPVRGAVLVQRMVHPIASGVLFTADPLTGARGSVTIEAVRGLGDALVDGTAVPERVVADRATARVQYRTARAARASALQSAVPATLPGVAVAIEEEPTALDDRTVRELTHIGRLLDERWRHPQDVEWALAADGPYVLQVRPITTIAGPVPSPSAPVPPLPPDPAIWTREKIQERFPDPLTPLDASFVEECVFTPGFSDLLEALGIRTAPGRDIVRLFGGYAHLNRRALLDALGPLPEAVREQLFEGGGASGPAGASMLPFALRLLRLFVTRHRAFERAVPAFERTCQALRRRDFAHLAGAELGAELDRATSLIARIARGHMQSIVLAEVSYAALLALLERWGIRDAARYAAVLSRGLRANRTVEMGERFQQLAQALAACPPALEIVRRREPREALACLRAEPAAAALVAAFDAFVTEFGHRAARYPLSHPRWREEPERLVPMLAAQADRGATIDLEAETRARAAAAAELHRLLRTRRSERILPVRCALLRLVLGAVRTYCGVLRENEGFYITKPFVDVKRLLGVVGCRLAECGRLAGADDVYFLTLGEIRDVLRGHRAGDLRGLVTERRQELEAAAPQAGASAAGDGVLRGVPVSPGIVTGRAAVLADPSEPFEPGSVLVTKTLNPSWFATVMLAGGVVGDFGGQLSHGAVLARELRVPAVLGVHVATRVVRAGQLVTVNGGAGTVTLASD